MKTNFIMASFFLCSTAFAACPTFKTSYHNCKSSSWKPEFQITSIDVKARSPFYTFKYSTRSGVRNSKFVADNEPRDVTIQTSDIGEVRFVQRAFCEENLLKLEQVSEEYSLKEVTVFSSDEGKLRIKNYDDDGLMNQTICDEITRSTKIR